MPRARAFWEFVLLSAATTAALGCGQPSEQARLTLTADDGAPRCATPTGQYAAVFTLRDSAGTCDGAKPESHDPMNFSGTGQYQSPIGDLAKCQTAQTGCTIAVRCTSDALPSARANLDAEVNADASEIVGTGTVIGSYRGCKSVTYDVVARRVE